MEERFERPDDLGDLSNSSRIKFNHAKGNVIHLGANTKSLCYELKT